MSKRYPLDRYLIGPGSLIVVRQGRIYRRPLSDKQNKRITNWLAWPRFTYDACTRTSGAQWVAYVTCRPTSAAEQAAERRREQAAIRRRQRQASGIYVNPQSAHGWLRNRRAQSGY